MTDDVKSAARQRATLQALADYGYLDQLDTPGETPKYRPTQDGRALRDTLPGLPPTGFGEYVKAYGKGVMHRQPGKQSIMGMVRQACALGLAVAAYRVVPQLLLGVQPFYMVPVVLGYATVWAAPLVRALPRHLARARAFDDAEYERYDREVAPQRVHERGIGVERELDADSDLDGPPQRTPLPENPDGPGGGRRGQEPPELPGPSMGGPFP